MKFWKQILLTTFAFFSIGSMTLYISCEKDACSAVQCQNGGNCVSGICQCPTGYEGTSCQTLSVNRYLGTYYGTTTDEGISLLDTIVVSPGSDLVTVNVSMRAFAPDAFSGNIINDDNGYHIVVPAIVSGTYTRTVNIDLQTKKLIISKTVTTDTIATYQFIGYKN